MLNAFRKLFSPPIFDGDDEKTRVSGLLNSILLFVTVAASSALPVLALTTDALNLLPLLILVLSFIAINIVAFILLRGGNVPLASTLFLASTGIGIFSSYAFSEPQSISASLSMIILIAFTALLLDPRALIRLIALIIVFTLAITIAQTRGWITPVFIADTNPISNWITTSFIFILTGLGLILSSISLRRALGNARASRENLEAGNRELNELRKDLELRVQERTAELEKRAAQLQTVSTVARTIATMQDIKTLLPSITGLVSGQFGFYHVGIFLIDAAKEYAVLRASNSEGGARMLDRQHQLRLDQKSIVGYATSLGVPRVALDVETDSVYFNNPDLAMTRSEMALPLRVGDQVIGALDVQSTDINAFTQEDINVLTTLANQVAIAIENARLFSETKDALSESRATFDKYARHEWSSFARQAKHSGFVFDGKQVSPMENRLKRENTRIVAQTGRLSLDKVAPAITLPIRLRGQTIGVLDVRSKTGAREWTKGEIAMLEAAAERAALALENARLIDSAQRRVARERAIADISSKIGAASDVDFILQAAVEELSRKISGVSEITLEIGRHEDIFND